jgi:1-pyrroline-4-hydroxy-2-carboxylate deaminase
VFGSLQLQIKTCTNLLGKPGGHVRPPLLPIDDAGALEAMRGILTEARLFANEPSSP